MNSHKSQIVFFGTPEFALPSLTLLANDARFSIVAVVTQPDKPSGRGQKVSAPPVKSLALELGLPVFQPSSLKSLQIAKTLDGQISLTGKDDCLELAEHLRSYSQIDAAIAIAYGKIIPGVLLDYPKHGFVNIHPSLLPRWRGAAPIQHTIFAGDKETGVAIMKLNDGVDTGPVYALKKFPIEPHTTFGVLHDKLASHGAELLKETLPLIVSGKLTPVAQSETGTTYANKWEKEDCKIVWSETAEITINRILTCNPHPGAFTHYQGQLIKVWNAAICANKNFPKAEPGTIVEVTKNEIIVATGASGYISLSELQLAGKKRLPTREVLQGFKPDTNAILD